MRQEYRLKVESWVTRLDSVKAWSKGGSTRQTLSMCDWCGFIFISFNNKILRLHCMQGWFFCNLFGASMIFVNVND